MVERVLRNGTVDRVAMTLSGLCLIHCILSIALISVLSSAGHLFADPIVHRIGLALATVLGAVALGAGWRAHRLTTPALIGGGGIVTMALALIAPHGVIEIALTMAGVLLLAWGHHLNLRARG